jgi:hypothetical protein
MRVRLSTCPLGILAPQHFREDGTCRCDDPKHVEMKRWGWVWNERQGRWEAP